MEGAIPPISKQPYDLIKENNFLIFSLLKRRKGDSKKNETKNPGKKLPAVFSTVHLQRS